MTAPSITNYDWLLRTIGIPGLVTAEGQGEIIDTAELTEMARLNKIAFLYLSAILTQPHANADNKFYRDLLSRHELLIKTLDQVCSVFNDNKIEYTLFKTIKPFPTTPSDVDVLLPIKDFQRAEGLLMSSGYIRTTSDAYSSTLQKDMIVDLQQQPSVSNLPYLPAQLLLENAIITKVNGVDVRTLNPEAELVAIASHSFYKEQLFTMNDYYSITILAEQADLAKVVDLATQAKVLDALQIIVGLCSHITKSVFNKQLKISELHHILKASDNKDSSVQSMPVKFPFSLVVKLLVSRASKDEEMRKKMIPAILRIATPGQLLKLLSHATRRTY
jgi:hypothetical protein